MTELGKVEASCLLLGSLELHPLKEDLMGAPYLRPQDGWWETLRKGGDILIASHWSNESVSLGIMGDSSGHLSAFEAGWRAGEHPVPRHQN